MIVQRGACMVAKYMFVSVRVPKFASEPGGAGGARRARSSLGPLVGYNLSLIRSV